MGLGTGMLNLPQLISQTGLTVIRHSGEEYVEKITCKSVLMTLYHDLLSIITIPADSVSVCLLKHKVEHPFKFVIFFNCNNIRDTLKEFSHKVLLKPKQQILQKCVGFMYKNMKNANRLILKF